MKYLRGIGIIFAVSFLGDCLKSIIPLPVPASIYGLALMFGALATGVVSLDTVETPAGFLTGIMPVLFVPAGAGLMASWSSIREMLLPALVIIVGSMLLVMGVSGKVTDRLIRTENDE